MKTYLLYLFLILVLSSCQQSKPVRPTMVIYDNIAGGANLDVAAGPNQKIFLVSDQLYLFDKELKTIAVNEKGDERQASLDFRPAISASSDGKVYTITRGKEGEYSDGHPLYLRTFNDDGILINEVSAGQIVKRNYVVGISAINDDQVVFLHTLGGKKVRGSVVFYQAHSPSVPAGSIFGIWRGDNHARLRSGINGRIFFASGLNDEVNSKITFSYASPGENFFKDLSANIKEHSQGELIRVGFPSIFPDPVGNVHISYGARVGNVFYNRYNSEMEKLHENDINIFANLGEWHLNMGLSEITASDDGKIVFAVALSNPDGQEKLWHAEILYSYSLNGGMNWSEPAKIGRDTHGGVGRRLPGLVAIKNSFYLFYYDNSTSQISCAVFKF